MLMPELLSLCVHCYTAMSGHVIYPQDDQQLAEELTCTYCQLVLNEPVEASESELRFCDSCFDKAVK